MFNLSECPAKRDPELWQWIDAEAKRQEQNIELIASENYASPAVMAAQGSCLTNKYAEGYPGKRYYGGCEFVDEVERLAIERAKKLFCEPAGVEMAVNVQPHSGAQANSAVFFAVLKPGDTFMGLSLADGGHLTHGMHLNFSGKYFHCVPYGLNDKEEIDYDEVERLAKENKPKLIVTGASAYSLKIDFKRFAEIAHSVGALLMVDMAHYAGLIAAGVYPSPFGHADIVTTTTHKTLRGPRGGMIFVRPDLEKAINSAVFPGMQGGPLMHVIAAKAVALGEALQPEYKTYQEQVMKNAHVMADADGEVFAVRDESGKMVILPTRGNNYLKKVWLEKTAARKLTAKESRKLKAIYDGRKTDRTWIDMACDERSCLYKKRIRIIKYGGLEIDGKDYDLSSALGSNFYIDGKNVTVKTVRGAIGRRLWNN